MQNKIKDTSWWVFFKSFPAVFFIVFFLILVLNGDYRYSVLYDSDINWLLKTGEYIFTNTFQIPSSDIFSYSQQGKEWVVYQWLFEVILYLSYSVGGSVGIGFLATGIFALTFTFIFEILRREKVNFVYSSLAITLAVLSADVNWYARPSIFTYLFTAIVLLIFHLAQNNRLLYLWFIPIIFIFWANIHLGFTAGLIILTLFLIYNIIIYITNPTPEKAKLLKTLVPVIIVSLVATLINPYGYKLYTYMSTLASSGYMNDNIKELLSPNFHKNYLKPVLVMIFMLFSLFPFARRVNPFHIVCLAVSTIMMLIFIRNIPFFGIFSALVLAQLLQGLHELIINNPHYSKFVRFIFVQLDEVQQYEQHLLNLPEKPTKLPLTPVIIVCFILLLLPLSASDIAKKYMSFSLAYESIRPRKAFEFALKYKPPGRFYASPTWGSYAITMLYPDYEVLIDSRFDMYGEEFFKEVHELKLSIDNWRDLIKKYKINWVVTPPNSNVERFLKKQCKNEWFLIYKDKISMIYLYDNPENRRWYEESGAIRLKSTLFLY